MSKETIMERVPRLIKFIKPKIIISKCLEFEACRYDGQLITNKYIRSLKSYIDFITVCPEVEIGLGIPRDPIYLINNKNNLSIYQPSTNSDLGSKMIDFSTNFLKSINNIDGIILKSKSPSCGIKTAKHYLNTSIKNPLGFGPGLFANQLIKKFPFIPKEEDIRLNDKFLREHFYTTIFVIADFRSIKTLSNLYNFHAKHKLLFKTYSQLKIKELERIVINQNANNFNQIRKQYFNLLLKLFLRRPKNISHINTQMQVFKYYKNVLSKKEKHCFFNLLDKYKNKKIPLSFVNRTIYSWNVRFKNKYLLNQSYFSPFPFNLIESKTSMINIKC